MNKKLKLSLAAFVVLFFATLLLRIATCAVAKMLGVKLGAQESVQLIQGLQGAKLAMTILSAVVLCPLVEEFLFRWLLFRLPSAKAGHAAAVAAIAAVSSAIFTFAHYINIPALFKSSAFATSQLDNSFVAIFAFGLAQCWLYRRTKAIWCPMLTHALSNATTIVLVLAIAARAKS